MAGDIVFLDILNVDCVGAKNILQFLCLGTNIIDVIL
jgi:hypothetical protein